MNPHIDGADGAEAVGHLAVNEALGVQILQGDGDLALLLELAVERQATRRLTTLQTV